MGNRYTMLGLFNVGDVISGYCNGYFGRDDYGTKVCVMVTPMYAVFEYISEGDESKGMATVLNYTEALNETIVDSWKK